MRGGREDETDTFQKVTPVPGHTLYNRAPYHPGDILWARETWAKDTDGEFVYRTDYGTTDDDSFPPSMFKWHPSIHMPREAVRIFLRVTDVRVERLKKIQFGDIYSEGVEIPDESGRYFNEWWDECLKRWIDTWNGTVKPADLPTYGWDANPWVWVIRFERISKEDALDHGSRGMQ